MRPGCDRPAAARVAFDPVALQLWLDPLARRSAPVQELCEFHVERLTVPRGWSATDRRPGASADPVSPTLSVVEVASGPLPDPAPEPTEDLDGSGDERADQENDPVAVESVAVEETSGDDTSSEPGAEPAVVAESAVVDEVVVDEVVAEPAVVDEAVAAPVVEPVVDDPTVSDPVADPVVTDEQWDAPDVAAPAAVLDRTPEPARAPAAGRGRSRSSRGSAPSLLSRAFELTGHQESILTRTADGSGESPGRGPEATEGDAISDPAGRGSDES